MSKEDKVLNNAIIGKQPMAVAIYACPVNTKYYDSIHIDDITDKMQEPESTKLVIDDFELKVKSAYNLFKNNLISKDEYIKIMDTIVK